MTKLNQLVAIEKGVRERASRSITDAYHAIQRHNGWSGLSRTYQPRDDDGEQLPPESTLVQLRGRDVIDGFREEIVRLFDVTLTKDSANCVARADVVVDGETLVSQAPITYLLFLEKQLNDWATLISKLPILDPSEHWTYDTNSGAYRSDPTQTNRSKKVPRTLVKYEATDKHPAQVDVYHEDVPVGTWTTTRFSGAFPADLVESMAKRVDALVTAVKFARETANELEVTDERAGDRVFQHVFGPALEG